MNGYLKLAIGCSLLTVILSSCASTQKVLLSAIGRYPAPEATSDGWKPITCGEIEKLYQPLSSQRGRDSAKLVMTYDFGKNVVEWDDANFDSFKDLLFHCRDKGYLRYFDQTYFPTDVRATIAGLKEEVPKLRAKLEIEAHEKELLDGYTSEVERLSANMSDASISRLKEIQSGLPKVKIGSPSAAKTFSLRKRIESLVFGHQSGQKVKEASSVAKTEEEPADDPPTWCHYRRSVSGIDFDHDASECKCGGDVTVHGNNFGREEETQSEVFWLRLEHLGDLDLIYTNPAELLQHLDGGSDEAKGKALRWRTTPKQYLRGFVKKYKVTHVQKGDDGKLKSLFIDVQFAPGFLKASFGRRGPVPPTTFAFFRDKKECDSSFDKIDNLVSKAEERGEKRRKRQFSAKYGAYQ